jgi:hypothetical protein
MEGMKTACMFWLQHLKGRDLLEDLGTYMSILLRRILDSVREFELD